MPVHVIDRATDLSERIQEARRRRQLEDLVDEFAEVLQCFPDYPATGFSSGSIQAVKAEAERVIEKIERWIDADLADDKDEQRLAGDVYRIRRALEEIDRWQRHYLRVPPDHARYNMYVKRP